MIYVLIPAKKGPEIEQNYQVSKRVLNPDKPQCVDKDERHSYMHKRATLAETEYWAMFW